MAPALTEPLSPKEKLSSSAATASLSTRASKKVESLPSTSAASATTLNENAIIQQHTTTPNNLKEKKPSRNTPTTTASTRVTRSKDAQQQSNCHSHGNNPKLIAAATSNVTKKNNKLSLSNEQMGLTAARNSKNTLSTHINSYNNNNINEKGADKVVVATTTESSVNQKLQSKTEVEEPQAQSEEFSLAESQVGPLVVTPTLISTETLPVCKDNSTEQLLADLTNDFEEAITAEICLRNKLPEVSLNKESAGDTAVASEKETATEEEKVTSVVISTAAGDIPVETAVALQHMESQLLLSNATTENATTQEDATVSCPSKYDDLASEVVKSAPASTTVPSTENNSRKLEVIPKCVISDQSAISTSSLNKTYTEKPSCSRAHIISMEILPPVGTDSTMTASEIEDNLEERLSQLDGKSIVAPSAPPVAAHGSQIENQLLQLTATTSPSRNANLQHLQEQLSTSPPTTSSAAFHQQQLQHQQQQAAAAISPNTASATSTLNSSSSNLQQGFLKENAGAGDELADQDIEEVLKALKGFENSNADTLVDLNVFFNDVFQTVNTYSNFEEVNTQNPTTSTQKTQPIQESYAEVAKNQDLLTDKIGTLLRRIRKLQARHMCKHTSTEIAGLFEWSARISNKNNHPVRSNMMSDQESAMMSVVSGRAPLGFWCEQNRSPVPSAQVNSLLKELRTVAKEQQLCTTPSHSTASYNSLFQTKRARKNDASGGATTQSSQNNSINSSVVGETKLESIIPNFDTYVAGELSHVSGLLHTEMREVQNAIDSDATESSSGGESADEMVNYNNQLQQSLSISKRAVWRYAKDRAAIALRWSWLLTQVNDLEVKIRQHNVVHTDANISKGPIVLEKVVGAHPDGVKSQDISNPVNNGYKSTIVTVDSDSDVDTNVSSRTRGLNLSEFRKRKLFQTTNMHTISKKAARPSTIKCGCQWPRLPCALCTGRPDPTAPRALPDTMMMPNRVALLDSGFHPMLSFPEDISHSIHFEAICRQPEWQQRVMRCQAKAIAKNVWKAEREAAAVLSGKGKQGGGDQTKRRYVRRKERNTTIASGSGGGNDDKMASTKGGVVLDESGNGTAPSSTSTSSTPLVANRPVNKPRQRRSKNKALATMPNENLSKTIQQNYNSLTQMSLISNNNNKNRKASSNSNFNSLNLNQYNNAAVQLNTQSSTAITSNINNGDNNFLNTNNGEQMDGSVAMQRSRTSSPTQGSKSGKHRSNRSRVSYDIDSIVIPYSIAAATRVEILPYKEIPTPKWRVLGDCEDDDDDDNEQSKRKDDELHESVDNSASTSALAIPAASQKKNLNANDTTKHQNVDKKLNNSGLLPLSNYKYEGRNKATNKNSKVVEAAPNNSSMVARNKITITTKPNGTIPKMEKKETPLKIVAERTTTKEALNNDLIVAMKEEKQNNTKIETEKDELLKNEIKDADLLAFHEDVVASPMKTNNPLINGKKVNDQQGPAAAVMDSKNGLKNLEICNTITTPANKTQNNILKMKNIEVLNPTNVNVNATKTKSDFDVVVHNCKNEDSATDRKTITTLVVKKNSDVQNFKDKDSVTTTPTSALDSTSSDPCVVKHSIGVMDEGVAVTDVKPALNTISEPVIKKRKLQNGTLNKSGGGDAVEASKAKNDTESMKAPPAPSISRGELLRNNINNSATPSQLVDETEDTSEELFMARHQRALIEERRKFITYLKFPFSTRSRANRRVDSRAESSGANTPDPMSPAPQTTNVGGGVGGDNESIPSPLAQTHSNANPLDMINDSISDSIYAIGNSRAQNKRQERRRTTSMKNKELERRSPTPEFEPPYEPLQFPLPEDTYQKMLNEMEESYKRKRVFYSFIDGGSSSHCGGSSTSRSASSARDFGGASGSGQSKRSNAGKLGMSLQRDTTNTTRSRKTSNHKKANNSTVRKEDKQRPNGKLQHISATIEKTDDDGAEYDDDINLLPEDLLNEVDDDDYPKHYLAPNDNSNYFDDVAEDSHKPSLRKDDSETDDADDPFLDDDPNDPEWKRGLGERTEQRMRKKV